MQNPALRQEPRYEPAAVIPLKQEYSLLDWLEANGRLIPREVADVYQMIDEDEEITELMGVDDGEFEEDDDFEDAED